MVPYVVGAVVAVTVMHVLLFVLHVCMLQECEGDSNAGVGSGGCSCGKCVVQSSAGDVLEMSVVRGVCVWMGVVGVWGRVGERIGFGVYQS